MDVVSAIMSYEDGTASTEEVLELFAHLIKTGDAFRLQGHYGRVAASLMTRGIIDHEGVIDWEAVDTYV